MASGRGICKVCGRDFALTKRGTVRAHAGWRNVGVQCHGSYARPAKPKTPA